MNLPNTMHVLERGWLSSNNIVFVGKDRTAIVDTGYCTHENQTLILLRHVLKGRTLDAIYNTHLHSDHCGGNHILQTNFPAARTFVPAAEFDRVQNWERSQLTFEATGQRCERFRADASIRPGDKIILGDLEWSALCAPGHHPYSYLLFCEKHGILISADALWEKGFGVVFPALDGISGFRETRATLQMIEELDVSIVVPGHGKPFTDVKQAIEVAHSRIDYLEGDPMRNAQNGIKVLLKFLLMERQRIKLSEVPKLLNSIPLVKAANQRHMNFGQIHLAHWAITQLRRAGALDVQDNYLVDVEAKTG
jgi:glyoxylase-like metal-dependent hydrolase (beta-lactamase superfamily II)